MVSFLAGLSSSAALLLDEEAFLDEGSLETSAAEAAAAAAAATDLAAWAAPADFEAPPPLLEAPFLPGAAMGTQTSLAFSRMSWMTFLEVGCRWIE